MSTVLDDAPPAPETAAEMTTEQRTMARRSALSGFLGSTIEYFDFVAFATASALVFNHLFFESMGPRGATIASFATFGVAYVARPLGAVLFGTLGDRMGRSRTLVYTLLLMGIATFAIGLLPTPATIGLAAPVLLVVLRLAQGLSAGGEQAGANALTAEHAPKDKRGLYTGWTMVGVGFGTMLGSAVFIPITAMGQEFLLSIGWRIPFLIAGPLALVTLYIRAQVKETESFKAVVLEERHDELPAAAAPAPTPVPLWEIVRDHWRNLLRVIVCSLFALTGTMANVFAINYGTEHQDLDPSILLAITSVIGIVTLPIAPLMAKLSDHVGRRPVFIGSVLLIAGGFFGVFGAMSTGSYALIALAMFLLMIVAAGGNIVQAPLYTEMFPTRVRYTGYAVGTQVGLIIVGFSPTIAAALVLPGVNGWVPVAIFIAVCMVAAAVSAFTAKETRGMSIEQIDEARTSA